MSDGETYREMWIKRGDVIAALEQSLTAERQQRKTAEAERDGFMDQAVSFSNGAVLMMQERDALQKQLDAAREALTEVGFEGPEGTDDDRYYYLDNGAYQGIFLFYEKEKPALFAALSEPQQTA